MDSSDSIGVYGEAKAEYTRQLCNFLVPALESYFLELLSATKEVEKDPKRILWAFQDALKQFPDWNMDKVQRETTRIIESTKCDYLEEILTAVFIAHTKVLSAIRLTSRQKKLQITIPKLEHFLHRTMSECARLLWSNAYLFNDNIPAIERQKNLRQVEQLLHEGVLQSIRGMLPVKSILKEYLADDGDEPTQAEETAVEETHEPVIKQTTVDETPAVEEPVKTEESVLQETVIEEPVVQQPVKVEEPVKEEEPVTTTAPSIDVSGAEIITVDTEPSVSFADTNTVFHYNPEKNIDAPAMKSEEPHYDENIIIDESAPAEDLDEFETLDKDDLAFAENEFETL
jgi:hypothetical protein